jgi:hypothetical protein
MAVAPASGAVASAPQVLLPVGVNVVARAGTRGTAWPEWVVVPVLELGRALLFEWYCLYYRLLLELACGSEVARPD